MKQVLITRSQLDKIMQEENGKLAADYATEADDFMLGLKLTYYVCDLADNILNRLFGELSDEEASIKEANENEAKIRMLKLLREWGEADE